MNHEVWLMICGVRPDSADGVFRIKPGQYEIGRSERCQIRLEHEFVSRRHATLVNDGGRLWIHDEKSRNGTFVNGKPVRPAGMEIKVGDSLRIGQVELDLVDHPFRLDHRDDSETPRAAVRSSEDASHRATSLGPVRKPVLVLLLDGLSEKQIAAERGMCPRTVHWHIEEMYKAFDVQTRAELAARFRSRDAIPTG